MKRQVAAGAFLLIASATSALAAGNCANPNDQLSGDEITALLVGHYAKDAADNNNEILNGGQITDYKKGPGDPIDPSAVIGTYTISGGSSQGTVTYVYSNNGGTYSYNVSTNSPNASHSALGTYKFCGSNGDRSVTINAGP
jgi:hypothetical protein